jgi:hypothetical protein
MQSKLLDHAVEPLNVLGKILMIVATLLPSCLMEARVVGPTASGHALIIEVDGRPVRLEAGKSLSSTARAWRRSLGLQDRRARAWLGRDPLSLPLPPGVRRISSVLMKEISSGMYTYACPTSPRGCLDWMDREMRGRGFMLQRSVETQGGHFRLYEFRDRFVILNALSTSAGCRLECMSNLTPSVLRSQPANEE